MSKSPSSESCNCNYEVPSFEHDVGCAIHFSDGRIPFYNDLITEYGPENSTTDNESIMNMLVTMRVQDSLGGPFDGARFQATSSPPAARQDASDVQPAATSEANSDAQPNGHTLRLFSSPSPEVEDLGSTYVEDEVLRTQIHDMYLGLRENSGTNIFDDSQISPKLLVDWLDTIIEEMSVNFGIILNRKDVWKALAIRDAELKSMDFEVGVEGERRSNGGGCDEDP